MYEPNDAKKPPGTPEFIGAFVRSSTLFYVAMAGIGSLIANYNHHSLKIILSIPADPLAASKLFGLGLMGALVLLIANFLFESQFPSYHAFRKVLMQMVGQATVPMALYLAIISAIGEELLFRAGIQPGLGLVATALIFGLLHIGPQGLLSIWMLWAVMSGLLMGWMFAATGSLWPSLICHFLVNGLSMLRLRIQFQEHQASLAKLQAGKKAYSSSSQDD